MEYNQTFEQLHRYAIELDSEKLVVLTCFAKEEVAKKLVEMARENITITNSRGSDHHADCTDSVPATTPVARPAQVHLGFWHRPHVPQRR